MTQVIEVVGGSITDGADDAIVVDWDNIRDDLDTGVETIGILVRKLPYSVELSNMLEDTITDLIELVRNENA